MRRSGVNCDWRICIDVGIGDRNNASEVSRALPEGNKDGTSNDEVTTADGTIGVCIGTVVIVSNNRVVCKNINSVTSIVSEMRCPTKDVLEGVRVDKVDGRKRSVGNGVIAESELVPGENKLTAENILFTSLVANGNSNGLLELTAIEEIRSDDRRNRKSIELLGDNMRGFVVGSRDCVTDVGRGSCDCVTGVDRGSCDDKDIVPINVDSSRNDVTRGEGVNMLDNEPSDGRDDTVSVRKVRGGVCIVESRGSIVVNGSNWILAVSSKNVRVSVGNMNKSVTALVIKEGSVGIVRSTDTVLDECCSPTEL